MAPGVITNFMAMFGDCRRAIRMIIDELAGDKEGAVHVCARQRNDQIIETLGFGAAVEGNCDLRFAARAPRDFTNRGSISRTAGAGWDG